jgi:Ca2+-transporting ATPase
MDDNFVSIVSAVEEGRAVYDNIRRFIKFSLAGNIGKVTVMLLAPFFGIHVALQPLQLLWLNLMTDGLLGLGLGLERGETDSMQQPPRSLGAGLFGQGLAGHILWVGLVIGLIALSIGYLYYAPANPTNTTWQTMIFTTLAFLQIGHALASRSTYESVFTLSIFTNPLLASMVVLAGAVQLIVIYEPSLDQFFRVTPLSFVQLLLCMFFGTGALLAIEVEKAIFRRRNRAT